jgi:hypothetical protein
MLTIKHISSGNIFTVSDTPVLTGGIWECGNQRFTDASGTEYEVGAADPSIAIAAQWESIKTERDRRESAGVLVGAKWFHSDADSRIKQLGLVLAGASIPAGLQWKTMDGSFVAMTQTLAGQIFGASLAATSAIFTKAEQHKAAMEASADPSAYDHLADWPAVYEPVVYGE